MDKTLIDAINLMAEGKEEGFNKVYSETYNHVYFRAKSYMKNEEDALDLVQIVFVEAYRNIGSLQTPEALFGWLDGITYRQGMKQYRKKKEVLLTEEGEGIFETLETDDISSMPELTADQKETSKIIRELIEELPVLQKIAMIAYYFDNLSVGQIAEIQECSEGTVKSRLNYGRKYLKDRIEEKEKKEGYRLHVFALPTLYFAIKMLAEETTMTVQAAQQVYNASCAATGLTAGTITSATVVASVSTGSTQAVAVAKAGKTVGMGAKFASFSTGMKAVVIASALTIGGAAVGGVVHVVTSQTVEEDVTTNEREEGSIFSDEEKENDTNIMEYSSTDLKDHLSLNKVTDVEKLILDEAVITPTRTSEYEYTFYAEDIQKFFEKGETIGFAVNGELPQDFFLSSITFMRSDTGEMATLTYDYDDGFRRLGFRGDPSGNVVVTVAQRDSVQESEGVEETQANVEESEQINLSETEKMQIVDAIAYFDFWSMPLEEQDYVSEVRYYIQTMLYGDGTDALPLGWTSDVVTEETVKAFWEDGFGIIIPDDYTYIDYGRITCNSEPEWDVSLDRFKYDSLEIRENGDGTYKLVGTFVWSAEGEEKLYSFEAIAEQSGNREVFGGLKITAFTVNK